VPPPAIDGDGTLSVLAGPELGTLVGVAAGVGGTVGTGVGIGVGTAVGLGVGSGGGGVAAAVTVTDGGLTDVSAVVFWAPKSPLLAANE
jgi:hypothetical protein